MTEKEVDTEKLCNGEFHYFSVPECNAKGCTNEAIGFLVREGREEELLLCKSHLDMMVVTRKEKSLIKGDGR